MSKFFKPVDITGVPSGTAPLGITSNTLVANLNADKLDGQEGSYYLDWTNVTNKPDPVITLGGDLTGSVTLTDLGNGTLTATVVDDSHTHDGRYYTETELQDSIISMRHLKVKTSSGYPSSNLGDPSIAEMGLFETQFNNKTEFHDIANLFIETSTDGTTWSTYSVDDTNKRRLVGGDSGSNLVIPYGTAYFRVRFRATSYVYLNALYSYFSSNGHASQIHIYKKHDSGTYTQHTSSTATINQWPGHAYLPFDTIPFHPTGILGTHFHEVSVVFIPSWNGSYRSKNINIYNIQLWGGYPMAKRRIFSVDENKNATFPAAVSGTSFNSITALSSTNPSMDGSVAIGTSTTVARADHVHPTDTSRAPIASPTFTGTPAAPTAATGTSTTQLATTAFVNAEIANDAAPISHAVNASTYGYGDATNAGHLRVGTGLSVATGTVSVSYGTTGTTACVGNDSRLSDARTPTSHTHGNITNAGAIGTTASLPIITTTSGVLTTGSFGTGAGTFCQGNDSRLSDARTPTAHTTGSHSDWPAAVTMTEVGYLDGVTSAIQTQLGNKQPLDADLTAIAAIAGTSGLLKKTAADTWTLDTNTYLTTAVTSLTGTANQVNVSASTGAVTLSLPQSIHTAATPQFASLGLNGAAALHSTAAKLGITQTDGQTSFVIGNGTSPRFALNGNSDGSFSLYDGGPGSFQIGITQKGGCVTVANGIRAQGNTTLTTGVGTELQYTGGIGYLVSYDRDLSQYKPLQLDGSKIVTGITGNFLVGTATDNGVNKLQVSGSANILGTGGTSIDFAVTGRMRTGDANGQGGVWLSSSESLFIGSVTASADTIGLYNSAFGWVAQFKADKIGLWCTPGAGDGPLTMLQNGVDSGGGWYNLAKFTDASGNKGVSIGYLSASQTSVILANTTASASALAFWSYNGTSWGERARISSGGKFLIGTATDDGSNVLQVSGNTKLTGNAQVTGTFGVGDYAFGGAGDLTIARTAAPTQGYCYYGNAGNVYFGYNGTNFYISHDLDLNSKTIITTNTTKVTNLNADMLDGLHSTSFEAALGNPSVDGYVLSSTAAGTRSWVRSVPAGTVVHVAAKTAPPGFLKCNGASISRTTYADLFAAITTTKGTVTLTLANPCVLTFTAHGFVTGDAVYLTTTGALPTSISANTTYYAIYVSTDTFRLATSYSNALAGTPISTQGQSQSGTHTLYTCPFGGVTATNFTVPDLRGEFIRGYDDARGVDSGRAFGSAQSALVGTHYHDLAVTSGGYYPTTYGGYVLNSDGTNLDDRVANAGTGMGTETRPRNVTLLACIKY